MTLAWDSYAIEETTLHPLDAAPDEAIAILGQLNPLSSIRRGLTALGLEAVELRSPNTDIDGSSIEFSISWALPSSGQIRIDCTIAIDDYYDGISMMSVRIRAGGSDPSARGHLIDGWPLIEPIIESQTRRWHRLVSEQIDAGEQLPLS